MINIRRLAAGVSGILAVLALMGGFPAAAHADETSQPPPKVELVLDVSGSMRATDIGGMSRIAAAQRAFGEVVDALPDQAQVGVRTLGATYPGKDKARGCLDSQQLVPVGALDRVEIKTAVATLRPTGFTPIGLALRGAAKDLGAGAATRRIVLITDGEDDCAPPNPCDVARELAAQGTHLVVDALGLTLDDKVRRQLTCIADATGGTYTAVTTEAELSERLTTLVKRGTSPRPTPPTVVTGAAACAQAPLLNSGVYTDRETFQEERWYRVAVPAGQELHASASLSVDRAVNPHYDVSLRVLTAEGRELARGTGVDNGRTDVVSAGLRYAAAAAADSAAASASASDPGAATAPSSDPAESTAGTTVCLTVSNAFSTDASAHAGPGFPVELSIDLVAASTAPGEAGQNLGQGWLLLAVLAGVGLLTGLIVGWLARWRIAVWRTN